MKHQVLGGGGGASVPARPMRASRAATAAVPPAKARPAAASTRRAARVSGNSKEEKKPESELEALRREVERLRRSNEELEQQLALAHHTVAQFRRQQQQQQIKADVESKAGLINHLIAKVHQTTYADVEQVLAFVDSLDQHLSTLSDETAVLKHFSWPERKADALREAAFEYRHLNSLLTQISKSDDITALASCEATLTKTSALQHKLEKSMARLVNLRSSATPSYKELRIPTDWMLDSGIASKMRLASLKLAKVYMKRSLRELDRETGGEALLAQSVRFTYRVHQFAGGLDCEAMHLFEDLMQRARSASSPP